MGHQLLHHIQFRITSHLHIRFPKGRIHPFNLRRIQSKYRILIQINLRDRIQHLGAGSFSFPVMLLLIADVRALTHMEGMYPVMAALVTPAVVDSAPRNNRHIRAVSDIKIIIDHIHHPGGVHHHRNMHLLPLRLTVYENINSLFFFLLLNLHMLAVAMAERNAVMTQVKRALLLESCAVNLP